MREKRFGSLVGNAQRGCRTAQTIFRGVCMAAAESSTRKEAIAVSQKFRAYIIGELMIEAFGLSDPGCVRNNNEDYFLLAPAMDLYLVADGMGGAQAGEHASRLAGETVAAYVLDAGETSGEILLKALAEANRRVLTAADSDPGLHGMGTTLTAAWRVGDELLLANVGDSRAYLYQDGQLHIITEDQTWVNEVGRKLGIGEDQLKSHPMRHVLTMAIGV